MRKFVAYARLSGRTKPGRVVVMETAATMYSLTPQEARVLAVMLHAAADRGEVLLAAVPFAVPKSAAAPAAAVELGEIDETT